MSRGGRNIDVSNTQHWLTVRQQMLRQTHALTTCVFYSKTSATRYAVHALSEQFITKQISTSPLCSCRNQYSSPKAAGQAANSFPGAHQDSSRNRSFRRKSRKFRMKPRDQDFLRSNLKGPWLRHNTIAKNPSSFEDF